MSMKRNKSHPFQEITNTPTFPVISQPTQLVMHVDEVSMLPAAQHAIICRTCPTQKEKAAMRRATRYTQAEQALTESFLRSQKELTTPQLEIDALLKSVYLIQTRVIDARESLGNVKALLDNRAMEPRLYQSLQRDRWVEERRLSAAEEFSKTLKSSLSRLPFSAATQPQATQRRPSNVNPNVNLARFLETSWRDVLIRRPNCRKGDGKISLPKIHRHNTLLPLVLPTCRAKHRPFHGTKVLLPPPRNHPTSIRDGSRCSSYSSSSAKSSFLPDPSTTDEGSVPIMRTPSTLTVAPPEFRSTDLDGIATIWRRNSSLSKQEILKDLVVPIPDYVNDLMAEFDSVVPSPPHLPKPDSLPALISYPLIPKSPPTLDDSPPSLSETSSTIDSSAVPNGHKQTKRRRSLVFSLPDALSSLTSISSRDVPSPSNPKSRSPWRISSPPSSFPSNFHRNVNEPVAQTHATPKRSSISLTDLRSVFLSSSPSTVPTVTPTPVASSAPVPPPPRPPKGNGEEKLFARIKRRMSVLKRF